MNDRQLRFITDGLGGRVNGVPREDGYDITVASEIMAILCLSKDIADLKRKTRKDYCWLYLWQDRRPKTGDSMTCMQKVRCAHF